MTLDDVISATDPDEIDQIISNWDIDDQQLEEEEHTSSIPQVNLTSTSPLLNVDVTSTLPLPEVNNNSFSNFEMTLPPPPYCFFDIDINDLIELD